MGKEDVRTKTGDIDYVTRFSSLSSLQVHNEPVTLPSGIRVSIFDPITRPNTTTPIQGLETGITIEVKGNNPEGLQWGRYTVYREPFGSHRFFGHEIIRKTKKQAGWSSLLKRSKTQDSITVDEPMDILGDAVQKRLNVLLEELGRTFRSEGKEI